MTNLKALAEASDRGEITPEEAQRLYLAANPPGEPFEPYIGEDSRGPYLFDAFGDKFYLNGRVSGCDMEDPRSVAFWDDKAGL